MTNEMPNSYNQFYTHNFYLLYMFRMNLVVHHQEHKIMYCITQFGTIGTIVQASLDDCTDGENSTPFYLLPAPSSPNHHHKK